MRVLLLRAVKVIGPAIAVAGLPILVADYVLEKHALATGRIETLTIADRYVERAETVVAEALASLRKLRAEGHTSCLMPDRQAFGKAAFESLDVQQIGVADTDGTLLCGEPMGSLTEPVRLPVQERGDPAVIIGILSDGADDRQAMVTLRAGDTSRLVARISRSSLAIEPGSAAVQGVTETSVFLEDGSLWYRLKGDWRAQSEPDAIVETITSPRFPIKVTVATSAKAALETVAPLKLVVIVLATFAGFVAFALNLLAVWRSDRGDSFTRAIRNREFIPYYQPVVDLRDGTILGCEVLVRWLRQDGTMVPPGQFLPYAEATGLIRDITRQVMEKTVQDVGPLYAERPDLKLSINLTAMHFNDDEIVEDVRDIYRDSGIGYRQLCFEVTEQHPLKDLALSRTIIGRIQAMGAAVALDDVGTGHGGLAYLQKLGVDIIKIDKMFIDDLGTDHSAQTIVDTLIELGTQLGLGIVAEGVERQDQADHLAAKGVITAQGFLFAPPLPAADFVARVVDSPRIVPAEQDTDTAGHEDVDGEGSGTAPDDGDATEDLSGTDETEERSAA